MPKLAHVCGVATVCLALVLLGACSDNPSPKAISSSTPSASPSPSAGGPPTLPPQARGTSKQAAVAFVRYAIDVLNYTAITLDTGPLVRLSSADCAECRSIKGYLNRIARHRGTVQGGEWSVVQAFALKTPPNSDRQVRVVVKYGKQVVHESAQGKAIINGAGRSLYRFDLHPSHGSWRISAIRRNA